MSYKIKLADLKRDGAESLTAQLVDRFAAAIDSGQLAPGEKLPPTRALSAEAGVNHLTAARVYRRLAELGYVTASVGRGTFVRALAPGAGAEHGDDWQVYALPERELSYAQQVMWDAFDLADEEGIISLATGFPSPDAYPVREVAAIAAEVLAEEGGQALSYLTADGLPSLREQLALRGRRIGFASEPDEILITSGAQQGISLALRAVLEPGDVVVVESPTFAGLLAALRGTDARVIGVPVDGEGFDVAGLESILARHEVKLVALQTASHNPTGRDLSAERRSRLAELAIGRNLFVLEDHVYADLRFEGEAPRPLRELAPAHVLYVNSLSKTVGGGLRLGWIAARGPVRERIALLKLDADFHTATLIQHIAARYLASGAYDRHIRRVTPLYRERRDALLASLDRHLAGEHRTIPPRGGHHLWVTLTRPIDERALYSQALRSGVTFTPGGAVTVERRSQTSLRLSFPRLRPEQLDQGAKLLAGAMREVRRRSRRSVAAPMP
ncbi:MAG TPA: PLP-dependent aminotransferase family protein [Thermoleophilaceae bacterium]|nr:PLP-dependent aminotransferase family protein [Thermoleophilaceae bacterium]